VARASSLRRDHQRSGAATATASGPGAVTGTGHGHGSRTRPRCRPRTIPPRGPRRGASQPPVALRSPACRRVRRLSRLGSGSPPYGGQGGLSSSNGIGHLRASRRPARWLWRASPGGASRGLPPLRMCPREIEAPEAHSQGVARPTVAPFLVHSAARDSRVLRSTRRGAAGAWCVRGPWLRSQAAAGRFPARRVARRFQRRLAPLRGLRRTSFSCSAPGPGSPKHRPAVAFGACRASAPARRPAVAWSVRHPRTAPATAGRLDGLLGGCGALLRHAPPEDCPP
jgi:hypothetical protein